MGNPRLAGGTPRIRPCANSKFVILSGVTASRSEAVVESKDPYFSIQAYLSVRIAESLVNQQSTMGRGPSTPASLRKRRESLRSG